LQGDHITLSQALKVAGLADTGGQAKVVVRAGQVTVNGEVEQRPARKLRAGDVVCDTRGGGEWVIRA
jgi:ribosome-associated protein